MINLFKRVMLASGFIALSACTMTSDPQPLASWNDVNSKQAIINFVEEVTDENSVNFVPVADRIATFDNDGTLWAEQPMYFQLFFAIDRIKALAKDHPQWQQQEPFASLLKGDIEKAFAGGDKALLELIAASHGDVSRQQFHQEVKDWLASAKHPKTGRLYTDMVYQPMLELLNYLQANDFKTYIVSGGGIEFMRPWTEQVYNIPPEQVIGSSMKTTLKVENNQPYIYRLPELATLNDKAVKPLSINKFIGKRPIAAFGNSDGDLNMLQWTMAGDGLRFALYVHHTDAEREWAYDKDSHIGRLDKGLEQANRDGWTVVDMKNDWKVIYPQ